MSSCFNRKWSKNTSNNFLDLNLVVHAASPLQKKRSMGSVNQNVQNIVTIRVGNREISTALTGEELLYFPEQPPLAGVKVCGCLNMHTTQTARRACIDKMVSLGKGKIPRFCQYKQYYNTTTCSILCIGKI